MAVGPPAATGDLASVCFGDDDGSSVQRSLIRAAVWRGHPADTGQGMAGLPAGLLEEALYANSHHRSPVRRLDGRQPGLAAAGHRRPAPLQAWLRVAAAVVALGVVGLFMVRPLIPVDPAKVASAPTVPQGPAPGGATRIEMSPELQWALQAYLSNPTGDSTALLSMLGADQPSAKRVALTDELARLVRSEKPPSSILVDNRDGALELRPWQP